VRKAPCPVVWVTAPDDRPVTTTPRTILYATDHQVADGGYALGLARSLARRADAELIVLSVRPTGRSKPPVDGSPLWPPLAAHMHGIRPLVRTGSFAGEVLRVARDLRHAVVVMGRPWCTGLGELFDPARAVRRGASCPVMSVHLPARKGLIVTRSRVPSGTNR